MSTRPIIRVGDTGTRIEVQVLQADGTVVDLTGATLKQIIIRRPDGTLLTATADFVTDGTDGLLEYFTTATDFTAAGLAHLQAKVTLPAGTWTTGQDTITIEQTLTAASV